MFKECRYDAWGVALWKKNQSQVPHEGTHQHDFEQWLDWYLHPLNKPWLGCYQPWNYQARAMTSWTSKPHGISAMETYEPSVDSALTSYLETDWVGITDFYDESLCLLLGRFRTKAAAVLFSESCRCANQSGSILGTTKIDTLRVVDRRLHSPGSRGQDGPCHGCRQGSLLGGAPRLS